MCAVYCESKMEAYGRIEFQDTFGLSVLLDVIWVSKAKKKQNLCLTTSPGTWSLLAGKSEKIT
jgi:hypothetical protein